MSQADGQTAPGSQNPQEADLLARWQASPVGRAAAAVYALQNEIAELKRLESHAGAFAAIVAEGESLAGCHRQLTRLLLRISAAQARERLAEQEALPFRRAK